MENKYLPDDEVINYEDTLYVNPQKSLDESSQFIETLRNVQNQNNAEINSQTYNLGTAIPSNLGGLGGGGSYFESRYTTPQGVALANNLMASNRYTALTEAMQNNLAAQKQRLSNAQKAAYRRAAARATTPANSGSPQLPIDTNTGGGDRVKIDINKPTPGTPVPLTNTSMKYQDPKTGKWYVLTNPKEIDAINVTSSLAGKNPKDGMTTTANGKVFRYIEPTDSWYEQVYLFGQG